MSVKSYGLWAFLLLNVFLTTWKAGSVISLFFSKDKHNSSKAEESYSYIGDDYPLYYPMGSLDTVAMTLQESVRFDLNASDTIADKEWGLLATIPKGFGRTRLGPEYRLFVITVYHQMHCLRKIQVGLLNRDDPISTHHHVLHCLNYLRQLFLCAAADSLEEGDFMKQNYDIDRMGDQLVCQDWERVYDELDENYENWIEWRGQWN